MHVLLVAAIAAVEPEKLENKTQEFLQIAVMEFVHYDPDGGEPDSSEAAVQEPPAPAPVPPKPEPKPEPVKPKPLPAPKAVESTAESAAPLAAPKVEENDASAADTPSQAPQEIASKSSAAPAASHGGKKESSGLEGDAKGGIGGGTGQGNADILGAYATRVKRQLDRYKKYPREAILKRIKGVVVISFTLDRKGNVLSYQIESSSGHAVFDDEAAALLKRVSPLPPMPKEIPDEIINLTLPLRFEPQ